MTYYVSSGTLKPTHSLTPWVSRTVFGITPWPISDISIVLCNFSWLLLSYTDFFPSPFCYNMQWMCIFTIFNKNKQRSRNADDTHHFSLTIDKIPRVSQIKLIPWFARTFQISGNPVTYQLRQSAFCTSNTGINMFQTVQMVAEETSKRCVRCDVLLDCIIQIEGTAARCEVFG